MAVVSTALAVGTLLVWPSGSPPEVVSLPVPTVESNGSGELVRAPRAGTTPALPIPGMRRSAEGLIDVLRLAEGGRAPPTDPDEVIEALCALGGASVEPVRRAVQSAPDDALPPLLICLMRLGAAAAPATDDVGAIVRSARDEGLRSLAARALAAFGPGAAHSIDDLRSLLLDVAVSPPSRIDAARAMASVAGGTDAFENATMSALTDHRRDVRLAMLSALDARSSGSAPIRGLLLGLVEGDDSEVRLLSARVLGAFGSPDDGVLDALSRLLEVETNDGLRAVADAMAALGQPGTARLCHLASDHEAPDVRLASLGALDRAGFPLRDRPELFERFLASASIGDGWKDRLLVMMAHLRAPARAVDALPMLRRLPRDAGAGLRLAALRASASLIGNDDAVVGYLIEALRENGDAGSVAASLLGRFPTQASRTVPALLEALRSPTEARSSIVSTLYTLVAANAEARTTVTSAAAGADADVAPWIAQALDATAPAPR